MTFGEYIDSKKLTYRQVSQITGISHPTIARYATGKRRPTLESFKIIRDTMKLDQPVQLELAKQWGGWHLREFQRWQEVTQCDLGEDE